MKKVSYKIAKTIKDAGYPQDITRVSYGYSINSFGYFDEPYDYDALYNYHRTHSGELICFDSMCRFEEGCEYCVAPTYIELWLWLWEEKNIKICVEPKVSVDGNDRNTDVYILAPFYALPHSMIKIYNNPEEAITDAIVYLAENGLIK